jgi:nucleoside transport protein
MENILFFITGLISIFGLALLLSNDKKKVKTKIKPILIMLAIQVILTWGMLKTTIGITIVEKISWVFNQLIKFGREGVAFVLGGIQIQEGMSVFFIDVLLIIIFTSVVIGILNYIKLLPLFIKYVGRAVNKVTGIGSLESFNAVSSMFFGQSEVFLIIKDKLGKLNNKRLYTISASAMGSVSASIIGAYMTMLDPKYVIVAVPLNLFSALIIASIVNPYTVENDKEDTEITMDTGKKSLFQVVSDSVIDGGLMAVIVAGMLIGFIALLAMIDAMFGGIFGLTLTEILGYILAPFAFIIGVPWSETLEVGSIMATKLISNEFVAMLNMQNLELSTKAYGILSTFLISFANFSSIGIIAGSVKSLNAKKGDEVAKFGLKLVLGATLASILSATVVGLFL